MALNFQRPRSSFPTSFIVFIAALVLSLIAAAGIAWVLTTQIISWLPGYAENFWIIGFLSFVVLVMSGLLGWLYLSSPICPRCGARMIDDLFVGGDAPVLWARNVVAHRSEVVININPKCWKCGYDPGKIDFGRDNSSPR